MSDDRNVIFPPTGHSPDDSPEWKKERLRMKSFIVGKKMSELTYEDLSQIARSAINSRYQYMPDNELIQRYYEAGGSSSEAISSWTNKYR